MLLRLTRGRLPGLSGLLRPGAAGGLPGAALGRLVFELRLGGVGGAHALAPTFRLLLAPSVAAGEGQEATEEQDEDEDKGEPGTGEADKGEEGEGAGVLPTGTEAGGLDAAAASLVALLPSR